MTRQQRRLVLFLILSSTLMMLFACADHATSARHHPQPASAVAFPLTPSSLVLPTSPISSSTPDKQPVLRHTSASVARVTIVPTPTPMPPFEEAVATPVDLAGPSTAPLPWFLAYDSDAEGNDEIFLLPLDGGPSVNITNHPAEDRHPAWSPDGKQLAFQSNRDGNWEIYILDLEKETLQRLTHNLAYDGAPAWSPDGQRIVFESYRDSTPCQLTTPVPDPPPCPDLEIYWISAYGGTPHRLTDSPGGDYQPVWSPDGFWIAFTSWRDGDKEVYVMPAGGGPARPITANTGDDSSPSWSSDGTALIFLSERDKTVEMYRQSLFGGPAVRLTTNKLIEERPTWWPDGSILFSQFDPGLPFEVHNPYRPGAYHLYQLSPDSSVPQPLLAMTKARRPAAAPIAQPAAGAATFTSGNIQAKIALVDFPPELELIHLDDIDAPDPRMVAGVDAAFRAWRSAVRSKSGHDYLGIVSDVFRPASYFGHRLGYLSWHKAGRAVDLLFDWQDDQGENSLFIVQEDLAGEVYWRLYLKCTTQDGSMGEPLTQAPWYFWWHPDPEKEPDTFINGGRRLPIPSGYFVDVTALAERFGWSRITAYHLDDFHWQRDSTATEYWHYQYTDGLTWYQAMLQVYPQERLDELFSRPVASSRGQTEEVMDGKGLPAADSP